MRSLRSSALLPFRFTIPVGLARHTPRSRRLFHKTRPVAQGGRVYVRRPWFTRDGVILWGSQAVVFLVAIKFALGKLLDGVEIEAKVTAKDKEGEEQGQDEAGGDEAEDMVVVDDDDALFVPMQYPKKLPKVFYKQSDPEWQEFAKFSRDNEKQKSAKKVLAEKLRATVEREPRLNMKIGSDIKVSRMWLDVAYPDGPPPEYARKGVLVLEDEIAWSTQTIPHADYVKIRKILWPTVVYNATKGSLKLFYGLQAVKIKGALGIELNQREKQLQLAIRLLNTHQDVQIKAEENGSMQKPIQKQNTERLGSAASLPTQSSMTSAPDTVKGSFLGLMSMAGSKLPMSSDFSLASIHFLSNLMQNWGSTHMDQLPPGCCYMIGDVELYGSLARCKMGIVAAYNPKDNKFIWLKSQPKRIFDRRQRAKGGP